MDENGLADAVTHSRGVVGTLVAIAKCGLGVAVLIAAAVIGALSPEGMVIAIAMVIVAAGCIYDALRPIRSALGALWILMGVVAVLLTAAALSGFGRIPGLA